ncbi:MAG: MBL fold metallo-hydrolase [Cycloclasticus sp.]|nr:MBL fold metallo-hydrolase [Cycloclasticus sp.]MBQ0789798.1 MBL fold metallo-hydrolase [Cycloclasticus sp.]
MNLYTKFLLLLLCAFFISPAISDPHSEQAAPEITLKTTHVRGNIYMLEGVGGFAGGNIGVSAGNDGLLLIDDQLGPMSDKISTALSAINAGKLRFILNTHWHGDHTGNNAHFSKQATIISHGNVRKRLMADQQNFFGKSPAQAKQAWPLITFDQAINIHFNDEDIRFIHYPHGHTDSDSVVYFPKSNVAHLGDHFFNGVFPFVDLDTGGNAFKLTENIKNIIASLPDDALVIPGHGGLSDMQGLKTYYEMLKSTTAHVQEAADEGESLEDIQLGGLPSDWTAWGGGFINQEHWIKLIYQSLPKK